MLCTKFFKFFKHFKEINESHDIHVHDDHNCVIDYSVIDSFLYHSETWHEVWDIMNVCASASGECLSGALWWEDLVRLAEEVGFCKPRLVAASTISVGNKELEKLLGKGIIT